MTCAFPLKGNCESRGCFRKRLGNTECEREEIVPDIIEAPILPPKQKVYIRTPKPRKHPEPAEAPDEPDEEIIEELPSDTDGRLIVCIGNKGYFNLK